MKQRVGMAMLASAATVFMASCATGPATSAPVDAGAAAPPVFQTQQYRLDAGDKVRLIVFNQDNLGGEFAVSDNGILSLPLIGEIPVAGRTIPQVQADITSALANGYLKDPKVSLEVVNFRPFYILGEVNKPGEYPYEAGLTVLDAVAQAGGFTYRANMHRVFVRGAKETAETAYDLSPQATVAPGDTIRIGERHF